MHTKAGGVELRGVGIGVHVRGNSVDVRGTCVGEQSMASSVDGELAGAGGDPGAGVDTLGEGELPTPPTSSK